MKAPEDSPTEETSHPIQEESDPVWKLLSAEFRRNPAPSTEWFAVRTVAKAMAGGQIQAETTWFSRNLRWLLPLPLAASLGIALLAGVALKITGASLDAINEIPLVGGLLELVGLVSLLNFLSRNALKAQKRAELLSRIRKLKQDFFG